MYPNILSRKWHGFKSVGIMIPFFGMNMAKEIIIMQKSFATCVHTTYYLVSPFPEFVLQRVISCIYQSQRILEIVQNLLNPHGSYEHPCES